jgi:hypothetical protein
MIKYVVLVCAIFSIGSVSMSWAESFPDAIGKAYSFDGKKALYEERHFYSENGRSHKVLYLSVDGEQFAHKELDYQTGRSTPVFRQEDTRYSQTIEVKWVGEQLSISYFSKKDGPERQKLIDVKDPLVIDAGFDQFIRENWDGLLQGDRLGFHFPAPSRLTLVSLVVENKRCSYSTDVDHCFYINASNWIFKLLVDPIELGYDKNSQRLKRFRGIANIQDENGEGLKVDIHYHYPKNCEKSDPSDCKEVNGNDGPLETAQNQVAVIRAFRIPGSELAPEVDQLPRRYMW